MFLVNSYGHHMTITGMLQFTSSAILKEFQVKVYFTKVAATIRLLDIVMQTRQTHLWIDTPLQDTVYLFEEIW